MSSQSSYSHNGNNSRSYYSSQASLSTTDSGSVYGATREMGPPQSLDFPPQPIEIDLNSSRTLPSPSSSTSAPWDSAYLQPHAYGDMSYGSSNVAKMQQFPMDNQVRAAQQDPITQWYNTNDGPWVPKVIPEAVPEERNSRGQIGNRNPLPFGTQYRQPNPSDAGSFQYGAPHSDSGYGTRQSIENTSVFSGEVTEREDCQSLIGHVDSYRPFGLNNEVLPARDTRTNDSYPIPLQSSSISDVSGLMCPTCQKTVKTRSELKKHELRHTKPFTCQVPGCPRTEGFSTTNDLDRHTRSKHPQNITDSVATKRYRCHVPGCKSKDKTWPRLDNFRSHLKRVHQNHIRTDAEFEDMIRRAECWEKPSFNLDQDDLSYSEPSRPDQTRASAPIVHQTPPKAKKIEPDWKTVYPDVMERSLDIVAPKVPQSEDLKVKTPIQDRKPSPSDIQQHETVKPLEVLQVPTQVAEKKMPLENVLLAPVGQHDSAMKQPDSRSSKPLTQPSRISPQGKGTRQTDVSAVDATLTEVIKAALAGAIISDTSNDRTLDNASMRRGLPNGKISPAGSWPAPTNPATSSPRGSDGHINSTAPASTQEDYRSLEAQKKAEEVLRTLHDLGYILQKDPSHSPRPHNLGSAASNKSENQVTCETCKKFRGRPCELKKHMKRHERPYGCTFLTCNKTFGSKNDWKRHENSQHFHLETWRCDEEKPEGGTCAKVCYRRQTFQDHLRREHCIDDPDAVKTKVETCRIGRNCQARFWCGFCIKLVDLKKKGLDAWTERFDHIDDHFMGRHELKKQSIRDWIPVDSNQPKGDIESPRPQVVSPENDGHVGTSDRSESGTPKGSSTGALALEGSLAHAGTMSGDYQDGLKRRYSGSDDAPSPKHPKSDREILVVCCQCKASYNPKYESACNVCDNAHRLCSSCTTEYRRIEEA